MMTYPIVIDGRNVFDSDEMKAAGFAYYGTGRPPVIEEVAPVRSQKP